MTKRRMWLWYLLTVIAVIAADQGLKFWTVANIPLNPTPAEEIGMIPGVVHLTYIRNTGAAFGMMQGGRWLFLLLLAAFCAMVIWAIKTGKLTDAFQRWLAVAAVGGAIGNGIDRAAYGYVVDMFEVEFMNFAVFNLADAVLCVACFLFIPAVLLEDRRLKKQSVTPAEDGE